MWPDLVVVLASSRHPCILSRLGHWLRLVAKNKNLQAMPEVLMTEALAIYKVSCEKAEVEAAEKEKVLQHVSALEAWPGPWTQRHWEKVAKDMYIAFKVRSIFLDVSASYAVLTDKLQVLTNQMSLIGIKHP